MAFESAHELLDDMIVPNQSLTDLDEHERLVAVHSEASECTDSSNREAWARHRRTADPSA